MYHIVLCFKKNVIINFEVLISVYALLKDTENKKNSIAILESNTRSLKIFHRKISCSKYAFKWRSHITLFPSFMRLHSLQMLFYTELNISIRHSILHFSIQLSRFNKNPTAWNKIKMSFFEIDIDFLSLHFLWFGISIQFEHSWCEWPHQNMLGLWI